MKVDLNQFRKRPTFDEVANIVNEDKYKLDLPSRTYIKWEDSNARMQFENFRDSTAEAELTRARRQAVEARVMPPPAARFAPPRPAADQTLLTTGQVASEPKPQTTGKKKKLTTGNLARLDNTRRDDDDEDMPDADAGPSNRQLKSSKSDAGQSVPEDTNRGSGPDGRGGGGSAGEGTKVSTHEMQTMMKHFASENSVAHGKLQEALAHHTQAHALTVQNQVEALGMSLAHEARRADALDATQQEFTKALQQ